jgi:dihydropteroate synthase
MGVLNVTPDSFSDGGCFADPGAAIERAHQMIAEGADIIDIGGESTRPGAAYVGEHEEIKRIKPVLKVLGKSIKIPISIDTRKSAVARIALDLGAVVVNDVSALRDDPTMGQLVQESGAGIILMHRKGHSVSMQVAPHYDDVVKEVKNFLSERISMAQSIGIPADHIIVDPGIGFGKTLKHNVKILANVDAFLQLGQPVLVGVSRKACIGELMGKPVGEREMGNAVALTAAIWQGAQMVRVHEVGAMNDVIRVVQALRNSRDS